MGFTLFTSSAVPLIIQCFFADIGQLIVSDSLTLMNTSAFSARACDTSLVCLSVSIKKQDWACLVPVFFMVGQETEIKCMKQSEQGEV